MSDPVVKWGLKTDGLKPVIRKAINRINQRYPGVVITSTDEPAPGRLVHSLHYVGLAVDFGIETRYGLPLDTSIIREMLGHNFDVLGPAEVPGKTHIHVEYDPK